MTSDEWPVATTSEEGGDAENTTYRTHTTYSNTELLAGPQRKLLLEWH